MTACYSAFFAGRHNGLSMTTKEKVIRESIERNIKRLNEIKTLLEANPLSRICELRMEAKKLFDENKGIEKRTSNEFVAKIDKLAKEEKKMFALAKKQQNSAQLIDEQVNLEMELSKLNNELYFIERRRVGNAL
jgi:hypothetical protein